MRLQQISLHLYLTTTLARGISLTLVTLEFTQCMCLLLFIRILAGLMAKMLDGLSTCGSQVVFLKRFLNVCVQRAHVTGCSLFPHEHSYCTHFRFSS